jgi:hypothetical protein
MPRLSEVPTASSAKSTDTVLIIQDGVPKQVASSKLLGKLPYSAITRFSYSINTVNPATTDNSVSASVDNESNATDWAVLMLPTSYDPSGDPVRLVIGCHGGGGTVTSTGSQTESYTIYKYLVANGYAVMDVGGNPQSYAEANSIDWYRVMGNHFAVNSYEKAYNYIIDNFNIAQDGVMLTGGSNGGLTSNNIYAHSGIPIKAMAGMSALVSMADAWAIPTGAMSGGLFSSYQNRANIIKIYGMTPVTTQAELNAATIEADKIKGFDPYNYNTFKDFNGNYCKIHTVPYKLWQPIDDPVISITTAREFVSRIKNAGGYAILREMASGGHAPETAGSIIGTFTYFGSTINLYPPMHELKLWFDRFND